MSALPTLLFRPCLSVLRLRRDGFVLLFLLGAAGTGAQANPTGGVIPALEGTIAGQGTSYVTVNQSSARAIIGWQSFSVGQNETTRFVQPSASSIALNRVLGGSISQIDGSILANGQIILINQNGIVIGPTGTINTASFLASTRDIADTDFTNGTLHFKGSNANGVTNQGTITALGGNVILLGKTVSNSGTINAPGGLASLDAADDLTLSQNDLSGSTVTVTASSQATAALSSTGVNNSGTITAAQAELRAVNGNLYALAINNGGVIRATTLKHQGGRILLTADGGKVVNAGTLDASATVAGGTGGQVDLLNKQGLAANTGAILARGGVGGAGGQGEISGQTLDFFGTTDFRAPGGKLGSLLLDPAILIIDSSANTPADGFIDPISGGANSQNGAQETGYITTESIVSALQTSDLTLSASSSITLNDPITSTGSGSLAFALYNDVNATNPIPLTLNLNAAITLGSGATLSGTNVGTVNVSAAGLVQNGIDAASAGSVVNLAAATYSLSTELLINKSLTLNGSGAILDGQNKTRVLEIDGTASGDNVNLNNLTLTRGNGVGLNNSGNGGGLLVYAEGGNSVGVSISNSTVSNNTATNGGGIFNDGNTTGSSASLALIDSTVTHNMSQGNAGGIFNYGENGRATATINNTTISFNSGQDGGGIENAGATGVSSLSITNSTIANNTASLGGGAIYNVGNSIASASLAVSNSTITGNSASYAGGGIANSGGTLALGDTILAGNTSNGTESDYSNVGGGLTDDGYNLYGQNKDAGGFPSSGTNTDIPVSGPISSVLQTDANGAPLLADNGGPTQTIALVTGSQALGAGGPLSRSPSQTDQRGNTRSDPTDIGAYNGPPVTPPLLDYLVIDAMNPTTLAANTEYLTTAMVENDLLSTDLILSANLTITLNDPLTSSGTGNLTFAAAGTPAITLNLNAPITFTGSGTLKSGTNVGTVNVSAAGLVKNGIDAASAGATVNLAAATYLLNAQLLINKNLTLSGSGANTILDGQNQTRVLEIDGTTDGDTVNLNNLTLTNGNINGSAGNGSNDAEDGGGLLIYAGDNTSVNVAIANSLISGNTAGSDGGGIYSLAFGNNSTALSTLINSTISGNNAGSSGGGIYNVSDSGGGTALATVTNSTISDNMAGVDGGGIYNYVRSSNSTASATVTNSTISGNTAGLDGGGIFNLSNPGDGTASAASVTLTSSTISGNTASEGGGIVNFAFGRNNTISASITLTSSTISGNKASETVGGGIYNSRGGDPASASVTLTNSTVAGNTAAGAGGGIDNSGGTLAIGDTILAGNTSNGTESDYSNEGGGLTDDGYNLYGQNDANGGFPGGGTGDILLNGSLSSVLQTDANGAPLLADNGGPTQTIALVVAAGNLALGTGSTSVPNYSPTDQRGMARNPTNPSIGAYEPLSDATRIILTGNTIPTYGTDLALTANITDTSDSTRSLVGGTVNFSIDGGTVIPETITETDGQYTVTLNEVVSNADGLNAGSGQSITVALVPFEAMGSVVLSSSATQALTITPAALTVALTGSATKTYDGTDVVLPTNNSLALTLSGVATGDTVSLNTATAAYNYASVHVADNTSANPGTITATGYGLTFGSPTLANDYMPTATTATAAVGTITPATITASLGGSTTKVYDGTQNVTNPGSLTLTNSSAVVSGDTVTLSAGGGFSYGSKDAGNGLNVTANGLSFNVSGTGANSDYMLAATTASAAVGTITPATITASLGGSTTKVYDGTQNVTNSDTLTLTDSSAVVSGDTVTLSAGGGFSYGSKDAGNGLNVTANGLNFNVSGTGANSDYTLAATTATAAVGTIDKASLTISAVTDTKIYDGTTTSTAAPTELGLIAGDTVTNLSQAFASPEVLGPLGSTLLVNPRYTIDDGNGGNNYNVTLTTAAGTITPTSVPPNPNSDSTEMPPLAVSESVLPPGFSQIPVSDLAPLIVGEIVTLTASDFNQGKLSSKIPSKDDIHLDLATQTITVASLPFDVIQTGKDGHGQKKEHLIASGSSTSASPSGNVVLLVGGSTIAQLFHGQTGIVIPPEFVDKTFKVILSSATEAELFQAIVDQAAQNNKSGH